MDIKQLFEKLKQAQAEADADLAKFSQGIDKQFNFKPGTTGNMMEGMMTASGGISNVAKSVAPGLAAKLMDLGVAAENKMANLPEMSKLRDFMSNPVFNKIREPLKAERNVRLAERADLDKRIREHKLANEEAQTIASYPKDPDVLAMEEAKKIVDEKLRKKSGGQFDPDGTNPLD